MTGRELFREPPDHGSAYYEGRHAWEKGKPIDHNKYDKGTKQHLDWNHGWRDAGKLRRTY